MKKKHYIIILSLLGFSGCFSSKLNYGEFKIEGKKHNDLIVNRIVRYDIDSNDGCVVEGQMKMDLTYFTSDSISGLLVEANSEKPIALSEIRLVTANSDSISLYSDGSGRFQTSLDDKVTYIKTKLIGYKSLKVDLKDYY